MGLCLAEGGLPDLLVELGQLPAQGDAALRAKGGGQVVQGGAQLVGCFVKDHGALFVQKIGQPFPFLLAVHRQKALEHPAGGVLPRNRQRRDTGRGGGHRHDLDAAGQRIPDDDLAGVGDAGHSGV